MFLIFLISIIILVYVYFGYILFLRLASFFVRSSAIGDSDYLINVTLLISVYNEERIIDAKIRNSLNLNYPSNLLEIIVVSDGSTDNTNNIVNKYKQNGVLLQHYDGRIGKTACLNQAISKCNGEIVIFSDANSMYDREAVRHIVRHFQKDDIGLVTGRTKYLVESDDRVTESTSLYTILEVLTKRLESRIGSCIGADGAIFAIRKKIYSPLAPHDINDFVLPLTVVEKGYRVILEEQAFCLEKTAQGSKGEFNRQVRITNRTLRAIFNHRHLLNPFKYPLISFEILSHKILRFLTPLFLAAIFTSSLFLADRSVFLMTIFVLQISLYVSLLFFYKAGYTVKNRLYALFASFIMVSIAYLIGWQKYLSGETFATWEPDRKKVLG